MTLIKKTSWYQGTKIGRWLFLVTALCVISVGFLSQTRLFSKKQKGSPSTSQFRSAPDFVLEDSAGKKHALSDLKGTLILLHFWASWCHPCLDEVPQWLELAKVYQGRPLKLLAVSLDTSWSDALKILPDRMAASNLLSLLDPSAQVSDQYGTYGFPETYLISPDLKILVKWVGPQDWAGKEVRDLLDQATSSISGAPSNLHH